MTQPPKLLDRVRDAVRTRHYSRRTEEAYVSWTRRYIVFHRKTHPAQMGAPEISQFLTWLAVDRRVSASTQNQALAGLLFLYKAVLNVEIGSVPPVVRARTPDRLPVVLSRDEIGALLKQLTGTERLIVMLLYGSGVRLEECLELRVKDLDFDRHQIVVRQGKGQKDRVTMLPSAARETLTGHLAEVRRLHEVDLARGFGRVVLPFALDRTFPNAPTDWRWQFVFPAGRMSVTIASHDPAWSRHFDTEARRITEHLGDVVVHLHHIGSTAIPGLPAKPIIDIVMEVADLESLDEATPALEALGYEAKGEYGIPRRRYFRKNDASGERTHHVHAFEVGTDDVHRHLAFRDYMIAHPVAAHAYGELKRELAQRHPDDIDAYVDGKGAFVKKHEAQAIAWWPSLASHRPNGRMSRQPHNIRMEPTPRSVNGGSLGAAHFKRWADERTIIIT